MITFHILTLFPESFPSILNVGLIGKAFQKKLFEVNTINIRDYSELSANSVDDKPFSGGAGMVLRPDIISSAIEKNFSSSDIKNFKKICFSAKGKSLTQSYLEESKDQTNFIFDKGFYVSPFFEVKGLYDISFKIDEKNIYLYIKYIIDKKKVFEASYQGKSIDMNEMNLLRTFFTISIQNIKVTLGIYIQALKLFFKGAKYINRPKISKTKFTIINERR